MFIRRAQRSLVKSNLFGLLEKQKRHFRIIQDAEKTQNVLDGSLDTASDDYAINVEFNKGLTANLRKTIDTVKLGTTKFIVIFTTIRW